MPYGDCTEERTDTKTIASYLILNLSLYNLLTGVLGCPTTYYSFPGNNLVRRCGFRLHWAIATFAWKNYVWHHLVASSARCL